MRKRVETERKTADTSSTPRVRLRRRPNKVQFGGAAPRTWQRPRAHQRAYHSTGWRAEEEEQAAAEVATVALPPRAVQPRVAAPARTSTSSRLLGGAGLGGRDMFSSLEHHSQLESLAHARLTGKGSGGAGLGAGLCASNLAALRAGLSAGLRAGLSAPQLSAGFGGQVSAAAFSAAASAVATGGGGYELLGSGCLRLPRRWRRWWW